MKLALALSDEELSVVRDLFKSLSPNERRAGLEMLGASLTDLRGPGQCWRVCSSIVRQTGFCRPPHRHHSFGAVKCLYRRPRPLGWR
jgi:hypothetical protein